MVYLSAKDAGLRWGISSRRVAVLCKAGRIEGAQLVAGAWIIPESTEKPDDARIKSGKYKKTVSEDGLPDSDEAVLKISNGA